MQTFVVGSTSSTYRTYLVRKVLESTATSLTLCSQHLSLTTYATVAGVKELINCPYGSFLGVEGRLTDISVALFVLISKMQRNLQWQDLGFSQPVILKPTKFFQASLRRKPALNFLSDLSFPSTFLPKELLPPKLVFFCFKLLEKLKMGTAAFWQSALISFQFTPQQVLIFKDS